MAQCEPYAESVEAPEEQPLRPSTVSVRPDERRYQPRIADAELETAIRLSPAASLFGPRGCGKTTTALQHADSAVHFDADPQLSEIAKVYPGSLLCSDPPTLLDEWRLAPEIFGAMRHECDRRAQAGQFILAGSAEPSADPARHAGEGRVLPVRMRTMSLFESGESDGSVSLRKLRDRVDTERAGQPAALVVLVGRGRAYRDGDVAVTPLTTLGP